MTRPRPTGRRRTVAVRCGVAALGVLLSVALPACSDSGDGPAGGGDGRVEREIEPRGNDGTDLSTTAPPIPGPAPAPDLWDIPDRAVPGLGDPRIDVHHYDVTLRADPGGDAIRGRAVITLSARTTTPLPAFTLDLRGPEAEKVTVDGTAAEFGHVGDQLVVTPATPLAPAESVDVDIAYEGVPEPGVLFARNITTGLQQDDEGGWFAMSQPDGTRTWIPANDHPSDKATWRITLDTPEDVVGVANGRLRSRDADGDRRSWVWEVDRPMATYLAVVAIGDYDLVERDGPAGSTVVSAFPASLDEEDRNRFEDLDQLVSEFSADWGAYPDDDLGVVVVPADLGVALETQTRPLFGTDTLDDGLRSILAHELAHQWWGDSVTPRTWDDLWLSEGFATWAQWLADERDGGPTTAERAEGVGGTETAVTSVPAVRALGRTLYQGGATALQVLRDDLGEEDFDRLLREWFVRFGGRTATTEDLLDLGAEIAGRDLTAWADTWLHSPQPRYPDG